MAKFGKVLVDIEYCVPCGYQNLASWAVSEMFAAGGTEAAIQLTPGDGGVFKISVDGDVWYDKRDFDGRTPRGPRHEGLEGQAPPARREPHARRCPVASSAHPPTELQTTPRRPHRRGVRFRLQSTPLERPTSSHFRGRGPMMLRSSRLSTESETEVRVIPDPQDGGSRSLRCKQRTAIEGGVC